MKVESQGEVANALTHGVGSIFSLLALLGMVMVAVQHGSPRHVVGAAIFGATLVLLYLMSTLYHSFKDPGVKRVFRVLDHSAIFFLIAGTYTPFCLVSLWGPWGWSVLAAIWGLAILGVTFKAFFGPRHPGLSLAIYLAMGWLVVVAAVPLFRALPRPGIFWLFGGGLFYTGGTAFYVWRNLKFHHAIWHLCVLGGSACHVAAVMGSVLPH